MLRGSALAKLDDKGRLKVPTVFRSVIEPKYGHEFFVTSIQGQSVRIYPMDVFSRYEERLLMASYVEPVVTKLRNALNYFGQPAVMDAQGRILIHPLLREKAKINGEVTVLGQQEFLEVWNRAEFESQLKHDPLSPEDLKSLSGFGF